MQFPLLDANRTKRLETEEGVETFVLLRKPLEATIPLSIYKYKISRTITGGKQEEPS